MALFSKKNLLWLLVIGLFVMFWKQIAAFSKKTYDSIKGTTTPPTTPV